MTATETPPQQQLTDRGGEDLIDGKTVAKMLNCSYQMVLKLRRLGELPSVSVGRLRKFRPEDVRAYRQKQ